MLWPLVLPFQITLALFVAVIAALVAWAPALHWKRSLTLFVSLLLAFVLFVPSCTGIMAIVDAQRFGTFHYDSFPEVKDFRVERFLPPSARNITVQKYMTGHTAKYTIKENELKDYLDQLWKEYGEYSSIPRADLDEGRDVGPEEYALNFKDLNWPAPEHSIKFSSPREGDGGGARYFYDQTTGTASHRAAYW